MLTMAIVEARYTCNAATFVTFLGASLKSPLSAQRSAGLRASRRSRRNLSNKVPPPVYNSISTHPQFSSPQSSSPPVSRVQPLPQRAFRPIRLRSIPLNGVRAAVDGPLSNNGSSSIGGRGPNGLDGPFFSFEKNEEIQWRDRVALYAQFSPEETLHCLLEGLRQNGKNTLLKDDGIEALYTFANFDVFKVDHFFFGRRMDLGQFERFRRVLITKPYSMLLHWKENVVLSSLRISRDKFMSRIQFCSKYQQKATFSFALSKVQLGDHESWMIDSVLEEQTLGDEQT